MHAPSSLSEANFPLFDGDMLRRSTKERRARRQSNRGDSCGKAGSKVRMRRDQLTRALDLGSELIVDNFAGGGGTSTGLEAAFGRPVDIAINHDPEALAMHALNHPYTKHLCESVWDVDPIKVTGNRPVGLVWLSPDCKHFSKAKGGTPVAKHIRGLAWVGLRWVALTKPRVLMLENVPVRTHTTRPSAIRSQFIDPTKGRAPNYL